ncbi:MAG: hypothetical protein IKB75_06440 [Clostridia bacterium]|nr:hypothetical protein [Clostridia bacterium]
MQEMLRKLYHGLMKARALRRDQKREMRKIKDSRRQKIISQYELNDAHKAQIDALFENNYGKKVAYDWHRYYASYTGNFDANFIPELLYIPVIEKKFNDDRFKPAFSDKNLLPLFVDGTPNIRAPKIYLSCVKGILRNEECKIIGKDAAVTILQNLSCFGKPTVDSNSGKMCAVYKFENGVDQFSNRTARDIIDAMGDNFCFQELVKNCESVSNLHHNSLNTFRITTYLWKEKVWHFPVIMRIGQGKSVLDNAHQGGMFVGLSDDGILNECAFTEFQDRYFKHPDSGIEFKGYSVPELKVALEAVELVHQRIPQIGMISWDAVVNDRGEVIIIEMNVHGQSVWLPQMAHGVGAFGENTADILAWARD